MARITLLGYGRMGKMIEACALSRGHDIVARYDNADADRPLPPESEVAIDFSQPFVAEANCLRALRQNIPVASGTTGWDVSRVLAQARTSDAPAFLHATNMSVGVNVVFAMNRLLAAALDGRGYGVEISETHHVHKLDAPSGTAITLAEGAVAEMADLNGWRLRTDESVAEDNHLPITATREGEVIGLHEVTYTSAADAITLRHEAFDRTGFALGAVLAAEYLIGKSGVFTMADVLGLGHFGHNKALGQA